MCIFLKTCYIVFKNIMEELKNLLDCALIFVVYNTMKHKPLRCITKWHLIICVGTCRKWCFLIMDKHHQCSWKPPLSHHGSKSKFHEALICMESIATLYIAMCFKVMLIIQHLCEIWHLHINIRLNCSISPPLGSVPIQSWSWRWPWMKHLTNYIWKL